MSEIPKQSILEKAEDLVGKMKLPRTRQEFPRHVFDSLNADDPAICVNGDLFDVATTGETGGRTVLTSMYEEAMKRGYDLVLQYDPATNSISFVDELLEAPSGHRDVFAGMDVVVNDVGGNNIVPIMVDHSVVKPSSGFSPDRVTLEVVRKIAQGGVKVCLFVNNADIFFGMADGKNPMANASAPERTLNPRIISDFIRFLRTSDGSHIVFADSKNKVGGEVKDEIPFHTVPPTTADDIRELLGKIIDLDKNPGALPLAAGTSIRDLRKRLKGHTAETSTADEVLGLLKKFKEEQVVAMAGGSVRCSLDHYDDDMVAMPEAEKGFWGELSVILQTGSGLLPQGCMLVGPPGTGKSVRARYMASCMGVPFLELHDISSSGLRGLKEDKLRAALEAAIRVKPCILFIDELDKALPRTEGARTGHGSENDDSEVAAMLQRLLDSSDMKGVFVVGAGNDLDQMNEALLRNGRFGLRVACLPPVNKREKIKVFKAVFAQVKELKGENILDEVIELVVNSERLQGASGADYHELIRRTAAKWFAGGRQKSLSVVILECLERFTFRVNERTQEMTEKAIEMHNAGFPLEGMDEVLDIAQDPGLEHYKDMISRFEEATAAANELATKYAALMQCSRVELEGLKEELAIEADALRTRLLAEAEADKSARSLEYKGRFEDLDEREKKMFSTLNGERAALGLERDSLAREKAKSALALDRRASKLAEEEKRLEGTIALRVAGIVANLRQPIVDLQGELEREKKALLAEASALEASRRALLGEGVETGEAIDLLIARSGLRRVKGAETKKDVFLEKFIRESLRAKGLQSPRILLESLAAHPEKVDFIKRLVERGLKFMILPSSDPYSFMVVNVNRQSNNGDVLRRLNPDFHGDFKCLMEYARHETSDEGLACLTLGELRYALRLLVNGAGGPIDLSNTSFLVNNFTDIAFFDGRNCDLLDENHFYRKQFGNIGAMGKLTVKYVSANPAMQVEEPQRRVLFEMLKARTNTMRGDLSVNWATLFDELRKWPMAFWTMLEMELAKKNPVIGFLDNSGFIIHSTVPTPTERVESPEVVADKFGAMPISAGDYQVLGLSKVENNFHFGLKVPGNYVSNIKL